MQSTDHLSPHFTYGEMTQSQTAARLGLDNTPGPAELANLHRLCTVLEIIREYTGCVFLISSAFRAWPVNSAVGGSSTSNHPNGLCSDTNAVGMTPRELCEKVIEIGLEKLGIDQLILEFDAWAHIGLAKPGVAPRHQVLTIRSGTGYMEGLS